MPNYKHYIYLIIACCLVCCSKSKENTLVTYNTDIYVTQLLQIYKPTNDTNFFHFKYDNQKRLTTITKLIYNTSTSTLDTSGINYFYYNGTEVKPEKLIIWINQVALSRIDSLTQTFYYDISGRLEKKDVIEKTGTVKYYSYEYNYLADGYEETYHESGSQTNRIYQTKDQQGVITNELRLTPTKYSYENIYDVHPNPLRRINFQKMPALENQHLMDIFANRIIQQNNNLLQITETHYYGNTTTVSSTLTTNYQITYNSEGYPFKLESSSIPFDSRDNYKYVFIY